MRQISSESYESALSALRRTYMFGYSDAVNDACDYIHEVFTSMGMEDTEDFLEDFVAHMNKEEDERLKTPKNRFGN